MNIWGQKGRKGEIWMKTEAFGNLRRETGVLRRGGEVEGRMEGEEGRYTGREGR